ncbi:hypothetical protein BaRGS_00037848 [Batillaria attramentaria]|uniref:Uncharacterized protein n=1 Tax=Batillaria attramentaria TaxID=370345 RepID=A0ABD0J7M2_9CAEN
MAETNSVDAVTGKLGGAGGGGGIERRDDVSKDPKSSGKRKYANPGSWEVAKGLTSHLARSDDVVMDGREACKRVSIPTTSNPERRRFITRAEELEGLSSDEGLA